MKRLLTLALLWGGSLTFMTQIAVGQQAAAPAKTKTEKHIKMIKVDGDGKKTEIDTVITGNAPFVWQGDTIGGGKEFEWVTRDEFSMDSVHHYKYKMEGDGKSKVIMIHSGKGEPMIWTEGGPGVPPAPHVPKVIMLRGSHGKNVIDLSDPGIISYDKKMQKDGTEKITIVRKPKPEGEEVNEDVMIHAPHGNATFHSTAPGNVKTVKVIKSEDGTTQIIETDEVIKMQGGPGETKFVGDDGKVIVVKDIKEGDQKKVEVTVEEEKKEVKEKK